MSAQCFLISAKMDTVAILLEALNVFVILVMKLMIEVSIVQVRV